MRDLTQGELSSVSGGLSPYRPVILPCIVEPTVCPPPPSLDDVLVFEA